MGKRKERRLAAKIAASRRVKLDIFAEPSGEVRGDTLHDEPGANLDQDHRAGVPTSPSSSGEKQQNPLLLLGQYSDDDEQDEEASRPPVHAVDESSTAASDDKVVEDADAGGVGTNKTDETNNAGGDLEDLHSSDTVNTQEANDANTNGISDDTTQFGEIDPTSQNVDASGVPIAGDLVGSWKVVLHEASNQYYYWNTETGETSWVIPNEVALETGTVVGGDIPGVVDGKAEYSVALHMHTHSDPEAMAYPNVSASDVYAVSDLSSEAYGTMGMIEGNDKKSSNVLSDYMKKSGEEHNLPSNEAELAARHVASYNETDFHSAYLIKYGRDLLLRIKALERSENCFQEHEAIVKEIEIRVADCEALSPYGSTLLPFWSHTEAQLKQLEAVIGRGETSMVKQNPSLPEEHSHPNNLGEGSEVADKDTNTCIAEDSKIDATGERAVHTESGKQVLESEGAQVKGLSSGSVGEHLHTEKVAEAVFAVPLASKVESHPEDVDMDVEMEVDEETVAGSSAPPSLLNTDTSVPVEQIIQPSTSTEYYSVPLGDANIPLPPDDEWIPPPPPESELVPPPPPEDPPVPYPPYADYAPAPYPEQYSGVYVLPTYEYYTPAVSDGTTVSYYVQPDGAHVVEPQQSYESAVASTFPEVAADASLVKPIVCYDFSTIVPQVPAVTSNGSSGFYIESGPVNYPAAACAVEHSSSVAYTAEPESISAPQVAREPVVPAYTRESDKGSTQASFTGSSVQDAGDALVNGNVAVASLAVTKSQAKATRGKKRTIAVAPTLRSNKKVASLVNKWKAAKEELHGDEDEEPEDAYEILEKKRQKEIEEWHARKIASGEAQDNANFLPLGGDWRERVKRRRAESKAEQGETLLEASESETKQPDLVELSKNLPSGWQAYWDESTKQVYYGNNITSETTWTRPTR